jgi:hypothetical protein
MAGAAGIESATAVLVEIVEFCLVLNINIFPPVKAQRQ